MDRFKAKKVDDPDGVLDFWPSLSLTPPPEEMVKSWKSEARRFNTMRNAPKRRKKELA